MFCDNFLPIRRVFMFIFRFDTGLSIGELEEDMTIPIIPNDTHPQLLTFTGKILVSLGIE